jgi:hypothetical protein
VTRTIVLDESTEGPEFRGVDAGCPLHFHCDLAVSKHEVDLEAALRPPEMDPVAELPVGPMRLDLHEDEVLQRPAEEFASLLDDTPARQGARDSHVEQIELRSFSDDLPLLAPLPGLDEGAEKRFDEDLVIFLHGLRIDAADPRGPRLVSWQSDLQSPLDLDHSGVYSILVQPNGSILREWPDYKARCPMGNSKGRGGVGPAARRDCKAPYLLV